MGRDLDEFKVHEGFEGGGVGACLFGESFGCNVEHFIYKLLVIILFLLLFR